MKPLYDVLMEIKVRPELYLGKPSLERLYAFINGYLYCATLNNYGYDNCLDGFNKYIADVYHIKTSHNWSRIIEFYSTSDDEAFKKFYKHLNNYIKKRKKDILE